MRRLLVPVLFGLVLAPLLAPGAAGAQSPTRHFSGSGEAADSTFRSMDPTGCIETVVALVGVDERIKEGGSPSERRSWAAAMISRVDHCAGTPLVAAIGAADLSPDAFRMDKLDTATLTTTMVMEDGLSGSSFTVEIAVSWEATSEPVRKVGHRQIWEQGLTMNLRTDGTSRAGTAYGTVTDGTTNFIPEPGTALLSSGRTIELSVSRG